jgi:phosphoribosylformylglycinamidine synthase
MVVDLPVAPLAAAAPEYDRPRAPLSPPPAIDAAQVPPRNDPIEVLARLIATPELASKRWIWEQYDHMVMTATVQRPGGDAAVVRVAPSGKAVAMTCDCTPRYCQADPVQGGRQAVAEAWRNLTAVGAKPLAITDCMNFGNPEKPDIMAQFAGCIEGMGEACLALDFPVVSGNVSFYNETDGAAIPPTPSIGGVGLIADIGRMATLAFKPDEDALVLIGGQGTGGWLGQSLYLRRIEGLLDGAPPPVDLEAERRNGDFVRGLIAAGRIRTCHDISDGGLLVAVAEMAMAGAIGAALEDATASEHGCAWLFGEDQGRYLIACPQAEALPVIDEAARAGVAARQVGRVGGSELIVGGGRAISVARLKELHERWLPRYMAGEHT